jgi:hypothetical protein
MTNARIRRVAATVLAVVLGLVAAMVPAGPAAAASCYIICDGWDPNNVYYEDASGVVRRCTDFRTIYTVDPPWTGYAQFRYSRNCRMAWVRGAAAEGGSVWIEGFEPNGSLRIRLWTTNWREVTHSMAVNDANQTARVCIAGGGPSSPGPVCGDRY